MMKHSAMLLLALASPALCDAGGAAPADPGRAVALSRAWAEGAFSAEESADRGPDRLTLVSEGSPGDTKINTCSYASRSPIRLGDRTYERGIGVNSLSVLRVTLARPAARFLADIGLDRNVDGTPASVRFRIAAAGQELFATEVIRAGAPVQSLDIPLAGAREIELTVDEGGDGRSFDQADWADARVVLEDGTTLWLDDLARATSLSTGLPFSFLYGGRSSRELLPTWPCTVADEALDATRRQRTLTFTDPETGLEVRAACTVYGDTPGADWTIGFANRGEADTPALEQIRALDATVHLGFGAEAVLHRLHGSACGVDDWMPFDDALPAGARIEFAPAAGKSSLGACPFYTVDWGTGGVTTAIGWTGQWSATVEHGPDGLRLTAGIATTHLRLRPGESIRGPRILQVHWEAAPDDPWQPYNLFRRTMLAHITPRIEGEPVPPPIVHLGTSFYEMNDSTEANTLSHLRAIEGLGFEHYWLDAYWTRGGFPDGMGNYGFPLSRVEPHDRFPNGLQPIGAAAHEAGMGFVLWFEPERVAAGTEIAREHPDWVLSPDGSGAGLLDLGHPEARAYLTRYLIEAIRAYGVDCLRIDFNIGPLPFWQYRDAQDPDRVGLAEIRYVEGLYRMWDEILAACPGLFIDNCASGGMRIDLETCARSIPLWRTDATIGPLLGHDFDQAALQNQVMTHGLNRYLPFSTSGQMGSSPYRFRSGANAGISFCEDCWPTDYPRAELKAAIAECKRLRPYAFGDFYPLSDPSVDPAAWCVWQHHRPAQQDGMVVAFRRHGSPYASYDCDLFAVDPNARYEVRVSPGYDRGRPVAMTGEKLRALRIEIDERPGSVVVEYRRVGPTKE